MRISLERNKVWMLLLVCVLAAAGLRSPVVFAAEDSPTFTLRVDEGAGGNEGEVRLSVSGYNLADLYAYELRFVFDPLSLRLKQSESAIPGFSVSPIVKDNRISVAHTKIGPVSGDSGDLTLGYLAFERLGDRSAEVTLDEVDLVDSALNMTTIAVGASVRIGAVEFIDIAGHWAEKDIVAAVAQGWINGYVDGTFRPQSRVTRAEFAAMFVRATDLQPASGNPLPFADSDGIPSWAKPYVSAAASAKLLTGYADGTFKAGNPLTRSEMTAIIVRASGLTVSPQAVPTFADVADIPAWVRPYAAAGAEAGLVAGTGNNRFAPHAYTTRAEAVRIILNFLARE